MLSLLFQSTEFTPSSIEQEITLVYDLIQQMKVKRGLLLLIVADTPYNERGIAEYKFSHTARRQNLDVSKVRDFFAIKH
jgi:hypothetical protein